MKHKGYTGAMPKPREGYGVVGATADAGRHGLKDSPEHTRKGLDRMIKRIDQTITDLEDMRRQLKELRDKV